MNRRPILVALVMLLLSASGVAARDPAVPRQTAPAAVPAPNPSQSGCFIAGLNGGSETPPNASPATGIGAFVLAPAEPLTSTRTLVYHIAFTNTLGVENNAHIHKGAPGVTGPPIIPLPLGNPISGTLQLNAQDVADLLAGLLYVNIHTTFAPGGEIRGQILPAGGCLTASLSGKQETPPNTSPGTGSGTFLLVPPDPVTTTRKLVYHIVYTGTLGQETVAHIHKGAPGVSGPPVIDLPTGNPKFGTLLLSPQHVTDLLSGLLYVNIHTGLVVAGEIRGQIYPLGDCFHATLSGANETPPNASPASGYGFFKLSPSLPTTTTLKLTYYISFTKTFTETAAHIHKAPPGVSAPPLIDLPLGNPISGTLTLTDQQAIDLLSGLYYVNVHSTTLPAGEIRGQIVVSACRKVYMPISTR